MLFSAEATALGRNPAFLVKMGLILTGLLNLAIYYFRRPASAGFPAGAGTHAMISLGVWTGVLLAGRSIAYL
ncbi:MAG: hypothetical protein AB7S41_06380 [Parvibaculaceae bacterium]